MGNPRRRGAAAPDHALRDHGGHWHRRHTPKPVAWGLAAIITWALLAATTNATAPPVATGLLLGMTLGQAAAAELSYGIGAAAITAAIDPLDVAAAFLSVAMVVAVVLAVAVQYRPHTFRLEPEDPTFVDAI